MHTTPEPIDPTAGLHTGSPTPVAEPPGARSTTAGRRLPGAPRTAGEHLVLTVEEAARALRISRGLAYELVARGEIPSLRFGRRLIVPRAKLLALLEAE